MKLKNLTILSLISTLLAFSAQAIEDEALGFGASGAEAFTSYRKNEAAAPKLIKKAYPGFSVEKCKDSLALTWVASGFDKDRNGQLELSEVTPGSGHCEAWKTGRQYTEYSPKLCDGLSARVTPVGIDEDGDGTVSSDEMHASFAECMVYPALKQQSASAEAAIDRYEREMPRSGRQ